MAIEVRFIEPNDGEGFNVEYAGIYVVIDGIPLRSIFSTEEEAREWLNGVDWSNQIVIAPGSNNGL